MSNRDIILEFLKEKYPNEYCDACILDQVGIKGHAQVNQICRGLSSRGMTKRDTGLCTLCHKQKLVNAFDQSPPPDPSGENPPVGRVLVIGAVCLQLPPNTPPDLNLDFEELQKAAKHGLGKSVLLLSGLIAEALLLSRHPDTSDRGPGLKQLVGQARQQKLFGRDTLLQLETLVNYRDLIHHRAQRRSRIHPNDTRIKVAVMALGLLCTELEDPDKRYV